MRFPDRKTVERIKAEYPVGTMVELISMDDPQAPPSGTIGEVIGVDDTGSLLMHWQNGSGLNVVYGEDVVRKLPALTERIKEQILAIRETGETNMFDLPVVQRIAFDREYFELVTFLETHAKEYTHFILTGEVTNPT